jgi:asparagine synthase (glutamine-hydrolysing)
MSGIVGMLDLSGAPVDAGLLRRMTGSLAYRGPDGLGTWLDGPVGLGHTRLCTTSESEHEQQPCSLDGLVWITADARVDGRADLVAALESQGRTEVGSANDTQLILHAYHAWAEACVERLLGDFAFAIWDGPARRLFCARDRFGVKPLYYACVPGCFVFSNTLDCVRMHPAVGDALNELAIGDFLLFGFNQDPATTTFTDVQRLPPAHSLTVHQGAPRRRLYWALPTDGWIRYQRSHEYVDRFADLLRSAVRDRLRSDRIGIWMSGGLDSTSIAATACELLGEGRAGGDFRAYTTVYERLIPDEERQYATLAADALGLPIHYFPADDYKPFDDWDRLRLWTPEPVSDPFLLMGVDQARQVLPQTRVMLCGDGGDEVLKRSRISALLPKMSPVELCSGIFRSLLIHRQRPDSGVRTALRLWLRGKQTQLPYPAWLNKAFGNRLDLPARWTRLSDPVPKRGHPLRAVAYQKMTMSAWPSYFESWDPGVTGVPVEGRYPFLDVRLVEYLMAIPPIPWCVNKQIVRQAMLGKLPDRIRERRKTPLAGDPLVACLRATGAERVECFEAIPELARYVDSSAIPRLAGSSAHDVWLNVRPRCLNHWLTRLQSTRVLEKEIHHELNGVY